MGERERLEAGRKIRGQVIDCPHSLEQGVYSLLPSRCYKTAFVSRSNEGRSSWFLVHGSLVHGSYCIP